MSNQPAFCIFFEKKVSGVRAEKNTQPDHSVENGVKPPHPPSSKRFTGSRDLPAHANDSPRSQLQFGRGGTPGMTVPMLGRYLGRDLVLLQNQSSDPQLRPCRVHTCDPARRPD